MNTIKDLISVSKSFTALYVEDDISIRNNYAKVFSEIFASLELAENGQDGLEKYLSGHYDIIITDINMPIMNGVDMIAKIIEKDPKQMIVVTSAHDESSYLLQLIDLGVEKFLVKPIDYQKLITMLFRASKRLAERKEYQEYQAHIEEDNLYTSDLLKELQKKNDELNETIHQLHRKENVNIALVNGIEKSKKFTQEELLYYAPRPDTQSAEDFIDTYIGDIDIFNDHLAAIEETLELLIHQKLLNPTRKSIQDISIAFCHYGHHLSRLHKFSNLCEALNDFGARLSHVEDPSLLIKMKGFLFGIADSLHKWRHAVLVDKSAKDIHYLDNSIISDCVQTESMLRDDAYEKSHKEDIDHIFF